MGEECVFVGVTVVNCNAINDNITRIVSARRGDLTGDANNRGVRITEVLSLHSFPNSGRRTTLAGSFGSVLGSGRVGIITRAVKKIGPTFSFAVGLLGTNGSMIASGGRLITRGKLRLLRTTGRGNMGCLFRTDINNNVPVVEPLSRYFTTGGVVNVTNVLGNAAGFVLAGVVRSSVDFRSTLRVTRRGNCTRGSPATSIRKRSTYEGIYVLTSLTFKGRICPSRIRARNVSGVALRSISCVRSAGNIVGLLNRVRCVDSSGVTTFMDPTIICGNDRLTDIHSIFGTVLIHNSTINSIYFCNHNTNGLPATSTIITSVTSYVGRVGEHGVFN